MDGQCGNRTKATTTVGLNSSLTAGINQSMRYMGDDDCRILVARHGVGAWELLGSRNEGDLV